MKALAKNCGEMRGKKIEVVQTVPFCAAFQACSQRWPTAPQVAPQVPLHRVINCKTNALATSCEVLQKIAGNVWQIPKLCKIAGNRGPHFHCTPPNHSEAPAARAPLAKGLRSGRGSATGPGTVALPPPEAVPPTALGTSGVQSGARIWRGRRVQATASGEGIGCLRPGLAMASEARP